MSPSNTAGPDCILEAIAQKPLSAPSANAGSARRPRLFPGSVAPPLATPGASGLAIPIVQTQNAFT